MTEPDTPRPIENITANRTTRYSCCHRGCPAVTRSRPWTTCALWAVGACHGCTCTPPNTPATHPPNDGPPATITPAARAGAHVSDEGAQPRE